MQDQYLHTGDLVSIRAVETENGGFLACDEFSEPLKDPLCTIVPAPEGKAVPPSFGVSCIFRILSAGSSGDETTETHIRYGQSVQLVHVRTSRRVTARRKTAADIEKECFKVAMTAIVKPGSWFKVMPRYKVRKEGQKEDYLHVASVKGPSDRIEVNWTSVPSCWRINNYSSAREVEQEHTLKGGDVVRLWHKELEGFLAMQRSSTEVRLLSSDFDEHINERVMSSLWQVEFEQADRGHAVAWGQKLKLKHVGTGMYLDMSVQPPYGDVLSVTGDHAYPGTHFTFHRTDENELNVGARSDVAIRHSSSMHWLHASSGRHAELNMVLANSERKEQDVFTLVPVPKEEVDDVHRAVGLFGTLVDYVDTINQGVLPPKSDLTRVKNVLTTFISMTSKSEDDDPLTREGDALPHLQQLLMDIGIEEVLLDMVMAPFEKLEFLIGKTDSEVKEALSRKRMEPFVMASTLVYRLIKMLVRSNSRVTKQFEKHMDRFIPHLGFGWKVADTLSEILSENATLLEHLSPEYFKLFVGLIKGKKLGRYCELVSRLCKCGDQGIVSNQNQVRELVFGNNPFSSPIPVLTRKTDNVLQARIPKSALASNRPQRPSLGNVDDGDGEGEEVWVNLAEWYQGSAGGELKTYFRELFSLYESMCYHNNEESVDVVRRLLPPDHLLDILENQGGHFPSRLLTSVARLFDTLYVEEFIADGPLETLRVVVWDNIRSDFVRASQLPFDLDHLKGLIKAQLKVPDVLLSTVSDIDDDEYWDELDRYEYTGEIVSLARRLIMIGQGVVDSKEIVEFGVMAIDCLTQSAVHNPSVDTVDSEKNQFMMLAKVEIIKLLEVIADLHLRDNLLDVIDAVRKGKEDPTAFASKLSTNVSKYQLLNIPKDTIADCLLDLLHHQHPGLREASLQLLVKWGCPRTELVQALSDVHILISQANKATYIRMKRSMSELDNCLRGNVEHTAPRITEILGHFLHLATVSTNNGAVANLTTQRIMESAHMHVLVVKLLKKVASRYNYEENVLPDDIMAMCRAAYAVLKGFCAGNPTNQLLLMEHVEFFLSQLGSEQGVSAMLTELFKYNDFSDVNLVKRIVAACLAKIRASYTKGLAARGTRFLDFIRMLVMSRVENQSLVIRLLIQYKADMAIMKIPRTENGVDIDWLLRQVDSDDGNKESDLHYHLTLISLLSLCCGGRFGPAEIVCQSLIPIQDVLLVLSKPDREIPLKVKGPYLQFLTSAYLHVQEGAELKLTLDPHETDSLSTLLRSVSSSLEHITDAGCFLPDNEDDDAEDFVFKSVLPFIRVFYSFYFPSTISDDPLNVRRKLLMESKRIVALLSSAHRLGRTVQRGPRLHLLESALKSMLQRDIKSNDTVLTDAEIASLGTVASDVLMDVAVQQRVRFSTESGNEQAVLEQCGRFFEALRRVFMKDVSPDDAVDGGTTVDFNTDMRRKEMFPVIAVLRDKLVLSSDDDNDELFESKNCGGCFKIRNLTKPVSFMYDLLKEEMGLGSGQAEPSSDDMAREIVRAILDCVQGQEELTVTYLAVFSDIVASLDQDSMHDFQTLLVSLGAANVVEKIISSSTVSKDVLMVAFGFAISLMEGGNREVQTGLENEVANGNQVTFERMRQLFRQVIFDQQRLVSEREALGKLQSSLAGSEESQTIFLQKVLRFTQLLCEGHYRPFQDLLREQNFSRESINLISEIVEVLMAFGEEWKYIGQQEETFEGDDTIEFDISQMNVSQIHVLIQLYHSLLEFMQGPCHENQLLLSSKRIGHMTSDLLKCVSSRRRDLREYVSEQTKFTDDTSHVRALEEALDEFELAMLNFINGLLEANRDLIIARRLVGSLDYVFLVQEMQIRLENYQAKVKTGAIRRCEPDLDGDICFLYYVTLRVLANNDGMPDGLSSVLEGLEQSSSFKAMKEETCSVEIVRDDQIEKVYFRMPSTVFRFWGRPEIVQACEDFEYEVNRDNTEDKLREFMDSSEDIIDVLYHQEFLASLSPLIRVVSRGASWWRNITFATAMIINVLMLSYYTIEDGNLKLPFEVQSLIHILSILHIIFAVIMLVGYFITHGKTIASSRLKNLRTKSLNVGGFQIRIPDIVWSVYLIATHTMSAYMVFYLCVGFIATIGYPVFFSLLTVDIIARNRLLRYVLQSVTQNAGQLGATLVLIVVTVYIYMVLGMFFFPDSYTFGDLDEDVKCVTLMDCYRDHLDYGFRGPPIFHQPENEGVGGFFFNVTYNLFVILILTAIMSGIIIDTFGEMRAENAETKHDMKHRCFVCGVLRETFENADVDFLTHSRESHNMWSYVHFRVHLQRKEKTEYTGQETYAAQCFEEWDVDMFPINRSLDLETNKDHEQDEVKVMLRQVLDHVEGGAGAGADSEAQQVDSKRSHWHDVKGVLTRLEDSVNKVYAGVALRGTPTPREMTVPEDDTASPAPRRISRLPSARGAQQLSSRPSLRPGQASVPNLSLPTPRLEGGAGGGVGDLGMVLEAINSKLDALGAKVQNLQEVVMGGSGPSGTPILEDYMQ